MNLLDPCMSLERIKKNLGVLGVVDMRQLLLKGLTSICAFLVERIGKYVLVQNLLTFLPAEIIDKS